MAYGKLIATLSSRSGDIAGAEDALSDAFVSALSSWPKQGIPQRPEAWLLTVARNRRIDKARRDTRLVITDQDFDVADVPDPEMDERLKLMFVCAHPAIDITVHTPLMLQTVLGLEAVDIARAFLVSPTAMAQRLVRAKRKIKEARIPFKIPDEHEVADRISAVLEAIYGAYTVDWLTGDGDLSVEAYFLSTILSDMAPDTPEVLGLHALIGFIEARRKARYHDGKLVPVKDQDVELWDQGLLDRSMSFLSRASAFGQPGRFQLEAAIQSVHATRKQSGKTDWQALSQLYVGLNRLAPSVGSLVAHAAIVAEESDPQQGLEMLDQIEKAHGVKYQPIFAVRADCLNRLGRVSDALEAYDTAIALCTHIPSRRWLEGQKAAVIKRLS